ncbi:MAG TPA: PhzF family phenazine biosynthesis protein [Steroidobacteraceae bacterium]|nr:PhzF family phenazine biosynthesis protein [Steroidobacteraceae bacterium]
MTAVRFLVADVFTATPGCGNPLAVVPDARGLSTRQMQALAREFGFSETTFVLPPASVASSARVRIFTPRTEVPFAGHPNIGTAVVLAQERGARRRMFGDSFRFEQRAGLVPVRLLRGGGGSGAAELTAPEGLTLGAPLRVAAAAACLGLPAAQVRSRTHAPRVASVGLPFLIVEVASRAALARARGDLAAHAATLPRLGVDAVFAWCRGARAGELHARTFSPLDGIAEDPATGSAAAAAVALLTLAAPAQSARARWRVHQGEDMGRPSRIQGTVEKGGGAILAVRIAGRAVIVMEGRLRALP